ncbi:hypothetical protein [Photobacterium leiognathi]|uniref:hypothetical protein n=1 Tax=Photobacterium leiognathi TaxID=553611 RepID=UPI002980D93E|nr:hypothetical protein [Photobacterium leiognathi]
MSNIINIYPSADQESQSTVIKFSLFERVLWLGLSLLIYTAFALFFLTLHHFLLLPAGFPKHSGYMFWGLMLLTQFIKSVPMFINDKHKGEAVAFAIIGYVLSGKCADSEELKQVKANSKIILLKSISLSVGVVVMSFLVGLEA